MKMTLKELEKAKRKEYIDRINNCPSHYVGKKNTKKQYIERNVNQFINEIKEEVHHNKIKNLGDLMDHFLIAHYRGGHRTWRGTQ